jgi:ubiquinone/menaquinone biosynthesis C-methylase UbiE
LDGEVIQHGSEEPAGHRRCLRNNMNSALYDSFIADYYDASPVVTGRTQDIAFYKSAAREFGDPILELGCGTGRVTMALAEEGYRVTGLDLSERMLERATQKRAALATEARERVHFVQGDMTGFDVGENSARSSSPSARFNTSSKHISRSIACCARVSISRPADG